MTNRNRIPSRIINYLYFWIGLLLMLANKVRRYILGYTNPRPFHISDIDRAIQYDLKVVKHWLNILSNYVGYEYDLNGKSVLELGPGADLGIGIVLLSKGAAKYNAIDANLLIKDVPDEFYSSLFEHLDFTDMDSKEYHSLKSQLQFTLEGKNDRLNYIYSNDFDLYAFKDTEIDVVFSQAAFEHFDDVVSTIQQLSTVVKSGTIFISEIDFRTHTRWIMDSDPLNIYRYGDRVYNLLRFRGSPNRIRPYEYKFILEKCGWEAVTLIPLETMDSSILPSINNHLDFRFRDPVNQMEILTAMICAKKR